MKQNIQRVNSAVPFPKKIPDADSIKLLGPIVREVAYGSAFHMQLKEFGTDIQDNNTCISSNCSLSISSCETEVDDIVEGREDMKHHQDTVFQIISPVKEHPVSLQEIHNGCERIKRSLFKTEDELLRWSLKQEHSLLGKKCINTGLVERQLQRVTGLDALIR